MTGSSSGVAKLRELTQPHINVTFALSGKQIPANHGYLLYSAIARATGNPGDSPAYVGQTFQSVEAKSSSTGSAGMLPAPARDGSPTIREGVNTGSAGVSPARSPLHKADWLAIELISGFPSGPGLISLSDRGATLHLRIPAAHYRDVLPLAGKRLDIGGHQIRLGLPVARPLEPAPSLYARVVTIKKFTEAEPFLGAVNRQLDTLDLKGTAELPRDEQGRYRRRIVTIHGKSVVGFSVAVQTKVGGNVMFVKRLSAIIEFRDLARLTSHKNIPIAQRLQRRISKYLVSRALVKRNVLMWEGFCSNVCPMPR